MFFSFQRYEAVGSPRTLRRNTVSSKRMAPMMRSPVKASLVMMRVRMSWMSANMWSSSPRISCMPY